MKYMNIITVVSFLISVIVSTHVFSVDEDYFIPYTDNYGYEYDPESGTYIKKDPPVGVTLESNSKAPVAETNVSANIQSTPIEQVSDSSENSTSLQFTILVVGLAGILLLMVVLAKTLKNKITPGKS